MSTELITLISILSPVAIAFLGLLGKFISNRKKGKTNKQLHKDKDSEIIKLKKRVAANERENKQFKKENLQELKMIQNSIILLTQIIKRKR